MPFGQMLIRAKKLYLDKVVKINFLDQRLEGVYRDCWRRHEALPLRLTFVLSLETMEARRQWSNIFKILQEKNTINL